MGETDLLNKIADLMRERDDLIDEKVKLKGLIGRAIPAVKSKEQLETFHGSKSKADKMRELADEMQKEI